MKINRTRVVSYDAAVYGRVDGVENIWLDHAGDSKYRWVVQLRAFLICARHRFAGTKVYINASTAQQVAARRVWLRLNDRLEFDRADALEDKYLRHA